MTGEINNNPNINKDTQDHVDVNKQVENKEEINVSSKNNLRINYFRIPVYILSKIMKSVNLVTNAIKGALRRYKYGVRLEHESREGDKIYKAEILSKKQIKRGEKARKEHELLGAKYHIKMPSEEETSFIDEPIEDEDEFVDSLEYQEEDDIDLDSPVKLPEYNNTENLELVENTYFGSVIGDLDKLNIGKDNAVEILTRAVKYIFNVKQEDKPALKKLLAILFLNNTIEDIERKKDIIIKLAKTYGDKIIPDDLAKDKKWEKMLNSNDYETVLMAVASLESKAFSYLVEIVGDGALDRLSNIFSKIRKEDVPGFSMSEALDYSNKLKDSAIEGGTQLSLRGLDSLSNNISKINNEEIELEDFMDENLGHSCSIAWNGVQDAISSKLQQMAGRDTDKQNDVKTIINKCIIPAFVNPNTLGREGGDGLRIFEDYVEKWEPQDIRNSEFIDLLKQSVIAEARAKIKNNLINIASKYSTERESLLRDSKSIKDKKDSIGQFTKEIINHTYNNMLTKELFGSTMGAFKNSLAPLTIWLNPFATAVISTRAANNSAALDSLERFNIIKTRAFKHENPIKDGEINKSSDEDISNEDKEKLFKESVSKKPMDIIPRGYKTKLISTAVPVIKDIITPASSNNSALSSFVTKVASTATNIVSKAAGGLYGYFKDPIDSAVSSALDNIGTSGMTKTSLASNTASKDMQSGIYAKNYSIETSDYKDSLYALSLIGRASSNENQAVEDRNSAMLYAHKNQDRLGVSEDLLAIDKNERLPKTTSVDNSIRWDPEAPIPQKMKAVKENLPTLFIYLLKSKLGI